MIQMLLELFGTFFIIGLFNFGGGGAMISLIQTQVVTHHGWLTEEAFANIMAISQSTPGPIGINCATYVGYQVAVDNGYGSAAAVLGSFSTTAAIVLPSFLIFLALVNFYEKFHTGRVFKGVMSAITPAVAGMIGAAAIVLTFHIGLDNGLHIETIKSNFIDWRSWTLFAAAFVAAYGFKVNPITVIVAGAVAGLLFF